MKLMLSEMEWKLHNLHSLWPVLADFSKGPKKVTAISYDSNKVNYNLYDFLVVAININLVNIVAGKLH